MLVFFPRVLKSSIWILDRLTHHIAQSPDLQFPHCFNHKEERALSSFPASAAHLESQQTLRQPAAEIPEEQMVKPPIKQMSRLYIKNHDPPIPLRRRKPPRRPARATQRSLHTHVRGKLSHSATKLRE